MRQRAGVSRRSGIAFARRLGALAAAASLVASAGACRSEPPAPPPAPPSQDASFSADRAWAHLEALVAIGPRPTGSEGAAQARELIRRELEDYGYQVQEQRNEVEAGPGEAGPVGLSFVNVLGTLPGPSADVILLAAAYDTPKLEDVEFVGANESASGPAVVLELGRVLALQKLPYTVVLGFLDGERLARVDGSDARLGSASLARGIEATVGLRRVRVAFFFERVGDADLRLARDLNSHRLYREMLWRAAAERGAGAAFPTDAPFDSPDGPHRAFLAAEMRRVVALVDERYGGDEPPGAFSRTENDDLEHVSRESLGTVGSVALAAIDRVSTRLAKIDRFARRPTEEPAKEPAQPAADPAPAPEAGPEASETPEARETPERPAEAAAPAPPEPAPSTEPSPL